MLSALLAPKIIKNSTNNVTLATAKNPSLYTTPELYTPKAVTAEIIRAIAIYINDKETAFAEATVVAKDVRST